MIEILLASAAVLTFVACVGLLRFGERENIVYARLHIAGVIDVACIFCLLGLGYHLVGLVYLILTPISAHSIAHAHALHLKNKKVSEGVSGID